MNKYLVFYWSEGEYFNHVETAREIFDRMDMDDCYDIHIINIYKLGKQNIVPCEYYSNWHCGTGEKMEIRDKYTGEVLDVGYGTDH